MTNRAKKKKKQLLRKTHLKLLVKSVLKSRARERQRIIEENTFKAACNIRAVKQSQIKRFIEENPFETPCKHRPLKQSQ